MSDDLMHLKVLLPSEVFLDVAGVRRVVFETSEGSYGLLPHRLDCVAALVPGILTYQTDGSPEQYVAVDEGVLTKAGAQVSVAVRQALGGSDLAQLQAAVDKQFKAQEAAERTNRRVMAQLESGFIARLEKYRPT
ncbi:F0F1 ATP synthase subunit epsilon (plasmid) [Hymenobacter psoromatis]|nr:F0F1 ATP synthase subunit epsilon [Hymenobacter psoromatis]